MLKRLQVKFVCITMTFVTVMLLVIFGLIIFFVGMDMESRGLQMLRDMGPGHSAAIPPEAGPNRAWKPVFGVQVDASGDVTVSGEGTVELPDEDYVRQITRAALEQEQPEGYLPEFDLRYRRGPYPGGQRILFADVSDDRATMQGLIFSCAAIGGVSFLVFLGLSILLARWAVKPVAQAWQQQKQFVADASHELKTPLTVIMTNAELLQEPNQADGAKQQFSESILTMSRQMRTLVEGLLELARVDNGAVKTGFGQVDLSRLAEETVLTFEPLFFEKGLSLISERDPGLTLQGSESHLRQVLAILLDNAMKYSAAEGQTKLLLQRQGNHCLLSVASPGASISREDQENIFKRFYRVDKTRTRDGSYGLGLSIAQRIVEEHRGKIWVRSEGGYNTFFVQLPLR